ncbi:Prefoldin subunit alpha [subsurface metagenome]
MNMENNEEQELIFKLSVFEQQIQQLQQQLQAIEQGIVEMSSLNTGLDELIGSQNKEILAPIGRGIFAKAKLISEELTVDIGGRNFVKKTIPATKKIIEKQIKKLEEVKENLNDNLERVSGELQTVMNKEGEKEEKNK